MNTRPYPPVTTPEQQILDQLAGIAQAVSRSVPKHDGDVVYVACSRCRGTGCIWVNTSDHGCPSCDGDGKLPAYRWEAVERGVPILLDGLFVPVPFSAEEDCGCADCLRRAR